MKRALLIGGILAANLSAAFGQNPYDALNMSREDAFLGTARNASMAGAMTPFGGDASAIKDNPAGLGVYRKCDMTITPNFEINNDGDVTCNINNFGAIINFGKSGHSHGYVTSSLGIAYNRTRNYSRYTYSEGDYVDNDLNDGVTDPYGNEYQEKRGNGEWNFAYGVNISNKVYFGLGINAAQLHYKVNNEFDNLGYNYPLYNDIEYTGHGVNVKLGVIVKPVDPLRISLAFNSPTWYKISYDTYYSEYNFDDANNVIMDNGNPSITDYSENDNRYDLQTPLKFDAGLGFVIGKKAVLGIDYTAENFSNIRLDNDFGKYHELDKIFDTEMKTQHTIKVGAEVQIVDGLAVRAGYAYATSPTEDLTHAQMQNKSTGYPVCMPKESQYITCGLGYRGKVFYADLAYVHKNQKEDYYEWMDAEKDPIHTSLNFNNIVTTIGFRF